MLALLAPLWEVWDWSESDRALVGVILLLFGVFGAGFQRGLESEDSPSKFGWATLAPAPVIIGTILVLI